MRRQVGSCASSAAISAGVDGTFALWMTAPFRPMTQTCVSAIDTSSPAKYSIVSLLFQCQSRSYRLLQKSRDHYPMLKNRKTERDENSPNCDPMRHRRSTPSQTRCRPRMLTTRQIGWSPADFLNAAHVSLPEDRASPKRSFFNTIAPKRPPQGEPGSA